MRIDLNAIIPETPDQLPRAVRSQLAEVRARQPTLA